MDTIRVNPRHITEFPLGITINESRVTKESTFIVAASDSLHPEHADYVCDGTDDQVEIQAAIDALPSGGGKVVLKEGTFNISSGIQITDNNIGVCGVGAGTLISTSAYIEAPIYITGDYVHLDNFKLKKNQGSGGASNGQGIDVHNADDVTISNIVLEGTGLVASPWDATPTWGIRGRYCKRLIYNKCHVSNTSYEALTVWEGCTGCVFDNNVVDHCGFGLVFEKEGTYGNTMIGNTVNDSQKSGGWDILIRSTHDNTVVGNTVINQGTTNTLSYAIQLDGVSYDNVVIGNTIKSAAGIHLDIHTFDNLIKDNVLTDITTDGTAVKGAIFVQGKGNIIDSNIINYFEHHGIYVSSAPHTVVKNNQILYGGKGSSYGIYLANNSIRSEVIDNTIVGVDHTGMLINASAGNDVSCCRIINNNIEDPYTEIANTLYADAATSATEIQVQYVGGMHLGQFIIVNPGVNEDNVRIVEISSNADLGSPAILTISPALGHDQVATASITGILTQDIGMRSAGAGSVSPIYTRDNIIRNTTTPISLPINFECRNNIGFATETSGTATLANGTTSIAVTHGLDVTPAVGDIVVTPIEAWGNMTQFYIDTYTSTQFTIHADINPGQDVDFAWKAIVL